MRPTIVNYIVPAREDYNIKTHRRRREMLIDVHAHQFPQNYIDTIARRGRQPFGPGADQTIEERLQLMDEAKVDFQVLSPANLVPYFEREAEAIQAARILNDGYADLTHRWPQRFKAYVSLPLPHVDASLREMARGLDQLGFAGVTLGCSILDLPVTGEELEPLYQEMNRRGAILFFHPVVNGLCSALINDFNLAGPVGTTMEDTLGCAPYDYSANSPPLSQHQNLGAPFWWADSYAAQANGQPTRQRLQNSSGKAEYYR
jgi:predicted TIM-barrel fold metal-dependent hydrolase